MIDDLDMIHYEILREPQGRDKPQGEKAKMAIRKCAILAEYYFFTGKKQKAETLLRQLGYKDKHIKKFLKKVEEISCTEEMEEVSETLKGRIAKKYLN
jgi:Holliday junction resolvasome RuvABC DNA-binding subunit|tara:strand:+ start:1560 stop:1853 length:294 start_codon:yes stop_codon:yes gene_type:complete